MLVKNNNNMNQQVTNQLHVITENGEQCFMWRSNQLTYIAQDRQELPLVLATKFGSLATKLDLSYNTLTSYRNINLFTNLSELILDNNHLNDNQLFDGFKQNLRLKTLSLNKNRLKNLPKLINCISIYFPNLEFLSLIGNPLCPTPICTNENNNNNEKYQQDKEQAQDITCTIMSSTINQVIDERGDFDYQRYRYFIIYHLPNLRFLDSKPISNEERDESLRRCFWMDAAKLNERRGRALSNSKFDGQSQRNQNSNSFTNTITTTSQQQLDRNGSSSGINNNHDHNHNHNQANDLRTTATATDNFNLTIMSDYSNDGGFSQEQPRANIVQPKGAFTRLSYKYTGKNSEGNRFIRNNDL